jgi:hypothetical protein
MKIEINLDSNQKTKLVEVIEELSKSNSIDSESIDDFIKLTIFIILFEYDENKESLIHFYKKNKELCKKTNNSFIEK